jgi:hypothetical protein
MITQLGFIKATERTTYADIGSSSRPIMVREGLWFHRGFYIERMDQVVGVFPDSTRFMQWVALDTRGYDPAHQVYRQWETTYESARDAISAIDQALDG